MNEYVVLKTGRLMGFKIEIRLQNGSIYYSVSKKGLHVFNDEYPSDVAIKGEQMVEKAWKELQK